MRQPDLLMHGCVLLTMSDAQTKLMVVMLWVMTDFQAAHEHAIMCQLLQSRKLQMCSRTSSGRVCQGAAQHPAVRGGPDCPRTWEETC